MRTAQKRLGSWLGRRLPLRKNLKKLQKPILSLDSVIDSKIAISLSIEKVSGPIICCFTSGPLILFRFRILPAFFRKKRFVRIHKWSINFKVRVRSWYRPLFIFWIVKFSGRNLYSIPCQFSVGCNLPNMPKLEDISSSMAILELCLFSFCLISKTGTP